MNLSINPYYESIIVFANIYDLPDPLDPTTEHRKGWVNNSLLVISIYNYNKNNNIQHLIPLILKLDFALGLNYDIFSYAVDTIPFDLLNFYCFIFFYSIDCSNFYNNLRCLSIGKFDNVKDCLNCYNF